MKRLLRARETGASPISGPCPRCGAPLALSSYEGTPVGICPNRHGALVEDARVQRILARRDVRFTDEFRRKAAEWSRANNWVRLNPDNLTPKETVDPCACPGCGEPMLRRNYSYQYFVQVDRCHACRLIWFDKEELELLQALVELKMAGGWRDQ